MGNQKPPVQGQPPRVHQPLPTEQTGTATVTVACKLPNGVVLRVFEMITGVEQTPMGQVKIPQSRQVGKSIAINGVGLPRGMIRDEPLVAGYALTYNVPKDFWDLWIEQNKHADVVLNGLIFAHERAEKTASQAKRQRKDGVTSMMEGLDPANPPKFGNDRGFKIAVTTADEHKVEPVA